MSRIHTPIPTCKGCFPRVSGDEPLMEGDVNPVLAFSPRERG